MVVVVVGPGGVQVPDGSRRVPPVLAAAALDGIDDSPAVAELWRAVMVAAGGRRCAAIVVEHPPDWPPRRIATIVAAARIVAGRVVARAGAAPDVEPFGPGVRVPRWWPAVGAAGIVALVGLAAVMPRHPPTPQPSSAVLVEGRVAVRILSDWTVQRITAGPGSRRVQVNAPEPDVALHITQAYAPEATQADTAVTLRRAIAQEPAGVFVDFRGDALVEGREAVSYSEIRPGRLIRWAVMAVGATRISIGCQSPPDRTDAVGAACAEAIRSGSESAG